MIKENFAKISDLVKKSRLDAFIINNPSDLFYISGQDVSGYVFVVFKSGGMVISPPLLYGQMRKIYAGIPVMECKEAVEGIKKIILGENSIKKIGFDPGKITVRLYRKLIKKLGRQHLIEAPDIISQARRIKSRAEINAIKKSCAIAVKVMRLAKQFVKPGVSELSISAKIRKMFIDFGVESAFNPIVASGKNSAYPHYVSCNAKLPRNGPVILDIGCRYRGYCSDLTRVIFLGKISIILRRYYENLASARAVALKYLKPGEKTGKIDYAARSFILRAGLGEFFIHSTGHGVGIDVHESPNISEGGSEILRKGMVVTVEPGVYKPGLGGLRIEDTILITGNGYEILTKGV